MSHAADVFAAVNESLNELDGIRVKYKRKNGEMFDLIVRVGETRVEQTTSEGDGLVMTRIRDYLITTDEIRNNINGKFCPQPGDQILETEGDQVYVMELRPLVGNGNAWRWHGMHYDSIRVHTKQIATEDA